MTHLELSNLMTDYVEGRLDADRAAQAEAHLDQCVTCRAMAEDIRFSIASCHAAADAEPAPWLLARIVQATIGERKPTLKETVARWLRPVWRPQIAYSLSMAIFSLSFILYAANVNIRSMKFQDVDPLRWAYRANSRGHMLFARAEKYYYDLRVVYEMQSILRGIRQEPAPQPATRRKMQAPGSASGGESVYGTDLAMETETGAHSGPGANQGRRSQAL